MTTHKDREIQGEMGHIRTMALLFILSKISSNLLCYDTESVNCSILLYLFETAALKEVN